VQSGGNGGGGIAGIAAKAANSSSEEMSSYDTMLADALTENEAGQKQAKWLMLAEIGAGMLGSTKPGFAGTGDAVSAGLGSYNAAKDALKAEAMGIASMGEDRRRYDQNREDQFTMAAMQAAAARSRGAASARRIPIGALTPLTNALEEARMVALNVPPPPERGRVGTMLGLEALDDPFYSDRRRAANNIAILESQINQVYNSQGIATPTAATGQTDTRQINASDQQ
jgi:hypothetical protein